jgi:Arc/MetJ-type ribon-helix-helix transcriptional regulator
MDLTGRQNESKVLPMTIRLTPEDERLIEEQLRTGAFRSAEEVIHRALISLPPEPSRKPRKNLVDVLCSPPFAGSELQLERQKDYPRPLDL